MKKTADSDAKNALLNILVFPGLGSLRSGRKLAGVGQIVLVVAGSALLLLWFFKALSQYYDLMFEDVKPQSIGWIGETGGVLFCLSWFWAAVTSFSLFRQASTPTAVTPPILRSQKATPDQAKIQTALSTLPQWQLNGEIISRTFEFKNFPAAMNFVNTVAELAEQAQHHPDIDVRWNKVTLALTTHDAGGLTEKDFALARECDASSQR